MMLSIGTDVLSMKYPSKQQTFGKNVAIGEEHHSDHIRTFAVN
jgi:hypothetical protein